MSSTPHHDEPGAPAAAADGPPEPVVSRVLAGAVDRRLATCPSIRPDAIADARALLASEHPPSGDDVAGALVQSLVAERLT